MKVLLDHKEFYALVTTVSRVAIPNSIIPAIMLEADGGKLTASFSGSELGIKISSSGIHVKEEGQVLVNASYLNDLVTKLPGGVIYLEEKGNKLVIEYGQNYFEMNTLQVEWKGWPDKDYSEIFCLPKSKLKMALKSTAFAAAKRHYREIFTGVLLNTQPAYNIVRFVGADSYRMACYNCAAEKMQKWSWSAIVPGNSINELIPFLQGDDNCSVGVNGNRIIFRWENFEMFSRIIDGKFPTCVRLYGKTLFPSFILIMPD